MQGLQHSPLFLIFALLGFWVAASAVFRRFWRRSKTGREWYEFNRRLELVVRRRAASIQFWLVVAIAVIIMFAAAQFRRLFHPGEAPTDVSALAVALIVVSSYIKALLPAALLTNLIWWLTPSMQSASERARVDLDSVSFRNATILMTIQSIVIVPACLAQIYLGSTIQ